MAQLDGNDILAEAVKLKTEYLNRNRQIDIFRDLVNMSRQVYIPESMRKITQEVHTPFAHDLLTRIVPVLVPDDPHFQRVPIDVSDAKEVRNADLTQKWLEGMHRQLVRSGRRDFVFMGADAAARDGIGVFKCVIDKDAWRDIPVADTGSLAGASASLQARDRFKKRSSVPFKVFDIDSKTYFPIRSAMGLSAVFEIKRVPLYPLLTKYGINIADQNWQAALQDKTYQTSMWQTSGMDYVGGSLDELTSRPTAEVIEYWSNEQYTMMIADKVVENGPNPYGGWIPYFDFYGQQSSLRQPEHAGVSVLFAIQYLVPLLDSLLTMRHNVAFSEAYPILVKHLMVADRLEAEEEDEGLIYETGRILRELKDEEYKYLARPKGSEDLNAMIEQITQLIQSTGIADVMKGTSPGANSPGWLVSQLTDAAKSAFRPIRDNLQRALSEVYQFVLHGVDEVLGEDVPVLSVNSPKDSNRRWISIGPDEIDGYYEVDTDLPGGVLSDKIMKGQFAAAMHQGGYVSRRYVQESLEIQHPEEMDRAIEFEQLKMQLQGPLLSRAVQEAGYTDILTQQLGAQMSQQGAGPDQVLPGGMRAPGLGMGLAPDMDSAGGPALGISRDTMSMGANGQVAPHIDMGLGGPAARGQPGTQYPKLGLSGVQSPVQMQTPTPTNRGAAPSQARRRYAASKNKRLQSGTNRAAIKTANRPVGAY